MGWYCRVVQVERSCAAFYGHLTFVVVRSDFGFQPESESGADTSMDLWWPGSPQSVFKFAPPF